MVLIFVWVDLTAVDHHTGTVHQSICQVLSPGHARRALRRRSRPCSADLDLTNIPPSQSWSFGCGMPCIPYVIKNHHPSQQSRPNYAFISCPLAMMPYRTEIFVVPWAASVTIMTGSGVISHHGERRNVYLRSLHSTIQWD